MAKNFCSNCGKGVTQEDKFCPECGNSLVLATLASEIPSDLDIGQPQPQYVQQVRPDRKDPFTLSRRTVFAISLWMIVMIVIVWVASGLGMENGSPLAKVIAGTALLSIAITALAWIVFIIGAYRTEDAKPKTAYEQELHTQAQKNRDMLKMAGIIILAIIVGILFLAYFVHIDLVFTLSPTTTP